MKKILTIGILSAIIGILGIFFAAGVSEAASREGKIVRIEVALLTLVGGVESSAEAGFFAYDSVQKSLERALRKTQRLAILFPTGSQEAQVNKTLKGILEEVQREHLNQEIVELLEQAEELAKLLLELSNAPEMTVKMSLVSTSIVGIEPPSDQRSPQEARATIRFNLTAVGGDAYVSDVVADATTGMEFVSTLASNAEMVGESGLFLVRAKETNWFEVTGTLRNIGDEPVFVKMWVKKIRWGTNLDNPEAHSLAVDWSTTEIYLYPEGTKIE